MVSVVGVRFRENGKIYHFSPGELELSAGEGVIVETSRGLEYGTVASVPKQINESKTTDSLKPVIRKATEEDIKKVTANRAKEKDAFGVCLEKIAKHGLEMKLTNVEFAFDGSKVTFYFTADGRVDFRELVKDLAAVYRTRIELRQIGVRDETRAMGGIGMCGREFCCHTFQNDFQPVSIRMAKEQNLSLNPSKIYGACGRLMCCIRYEEETYRILSKNMPHVGEETVTEDGCRGTVNSVNILDQKIRVLVELSNDEKEIREYEPGVLEFTKKKKHPNKENPKQSAEKEEESGKRRHKQKQSKKENRSEEQA